MNRDANPFFGTNQPSQVSGPDELLADKVRGIATHLTGYERGILYMAAARLAANAALAARCETMQAAIDELVACKDATDQLNIDICEGDAPFPSEPNRLYRMKREANAWTAIRALAKESESSIPQSQAEGRDERTND